MNSYDINVFFPANRSHHHQHGHPRQLHDLRQLLRTLRQILPRRRVQDGLLDGGHWLERLLLLRSQSNAVLARHEGHEHPERVPRQLLLLHAQAIDGPQLLGTPLERSGRRRGLRLAQDLLPRLLLDSDVQQWNHHAATLPLHERAVLQVQTLEGEIYLSIYCCSTSRSFFF